MQRFFPEGEATNVQWRTPLPNWSNASPVVVGKRVFVTADPLDIAPLLLCIDADSGKELWRRELDHVTCLPEADQDKVRTLWSQQRVLDRQAARLFAEMRAAERALKKAPDDADAKAAWADWEERAKAVDFAIDPKGKNVGKWGGVPLADGYLPQDLKGAAGFLRGYNCYPLMWELGMSKGASAAGRRLPGWSHPTPVATAPTSTSTPATTMSRRGRSTVRWSGSAGWARPRRQGRWLVDYTMSPLLVDGRLLISSKAALTALDPATGDEVWSVAIDPATAS